MDRQEDYGSFVKLNKRELTELERQIMSPAWRIWEIVIDRVNNWGHAAFRPGELAKLAYGSNTKETRRSVRDQMIILARLQRIAPVCDNGSTELCVMVNKRIARRDAGKGGRTDVCYEVGHMEIRDKAWSPEVAIIPSARETVGKPAESMHEDWIDPMDDNDLRYCRGCEPLLDSRSFDELRVIHNDALAGGIYP